MKIFYFLLHLKSQFKEKKLSLNQFLIDIDKKKLTTSRIKCSFIILYQHNLSFRNLIFELTSKIQN
jgi:hypothetical protein